MEQLAHSHRPPGQAHRHMQTTMKDKNIRLKNREISWVAFNHRVLQEAADPRVPLYERIKFLAIFSSNLDEFFRVRVAGVRAMLNLKKKARKKLEVDPDKLLKRIYKVVSRQQEEFGEIFRNDIRKELQRQGIFIMRDNNLSDNQRRFVQTYFAENVQSYVDPVFVSKEKEAPFLENKQLYMIVSLTRKPLQPNRTDEKEQTELQYAIMRIPTDRAGRFVMLPQLNGQHFIMFLDDVMRACLPELFPSHKVLGAYAVKLTRDAELYIDDELSGDLVETMKRALEKRKTGVPARFLYDPDIAGKLLALLKEIFSFHDDDLIPGGRYHNFNDLFSFPNPKAPKLTYEPMQTLVLNDKYGSVFDRVGAEDVLLYYPYHSYDPVINFLQEAADDPQVTSIRITLYRVARNSRVVEQLIRASLNGKAVTAFVEVKARFDEESNIRWAEELEKSGARVLYSFSDLKVHAKLCLVEKTSGDAVRRYAYLSTGNFNESAAMVYTDFGFFTSDEKLTGEVARVFEILSRERKKWDFELLLVAPFNMREGYENLIEREIKSARKGREAYIIAKMNSLEDPVMITKLYKASQAGVKVSLVVRGICCLIPGVQGMSENIEIVSIVDRYLEHARAYIFCNGGSPLVYLASADWMTRNLSRRIEVAFPLVAVKLQRHVRTIVDLQLRDTAKARIINKKQNNQRRPGADDGGIHSQYAIHDFLRSQ